MLTTAELSKANQSLAESDSRASLSYFAEYIAAPEVNETIEISEHPGLDFYYVVWGEDGRRRIATVWRSRELYERDGERVRALLQGSPTQTHGLIGKFAVRRKSIWKRVPWYTILLGIAAALGAVQAIGNHFDWLFSAPSLTMKSANSRLHLTEGLDFVETTVLVNDLPIAQRHVELTGTIAASPLTPAVNVNVSPPSVAHIAGGGSHEVTVSGVAPKQGKYEFTLSARAKAGQLRASEQFHFRRPITVWPRTPVGTLTVARADGQTALFRGELTVGPAAPYGLNCEFELRGLGGVSYDGLLAFPVLNNSTKWRSVESPGKEVAVLQWSAMPVGARELIPFRLALSRAGATDWNQIPNRSDIRCDYRQERDR